MPYIVLGVILLWLLFGDPKNDIAGWIWPNAPAPWEEIDAYFYPNRNDLSVHNSFNGLASLEACRRWATEQARENGDLGYLRSDYECGVGHLVSGPKRVE